MQQVADLPQPTRWAAFHLVGARAGALGDQLKRQSLHGQCRDVVRAAKFIIDALHQPPARAVYKTNRLVQRRRIGLQAIQECRASLDMEAPSRTIVPAIHMDFAHGMERQRPPATLARLAVNDLPAATLQDEIEGRKEIPSR